MATSPRLPAELGPSRAAPVAIRVGHDPIDPGLVACLTRPRAYPHDPTASVGVDFVQTHLSWVFLTGTRVYKVRKDVDLGFVSFRSRAERDADCAREVRLNRRLAPDVYLGVASIERCDGALQVGPLVEDPNIDAGREKAVELCVVMRRLPRARDGLSLLTAKRLRAAHLDRVAERIARFHEEHRIGETQESVEVRLARSTDPALDNLQALEAFEGRVVPRATLRRAAERTRSFLELHRDRLERRARGRSFVDGHGDLHLAHVWFERDEAEPLIVDCLEFNDDLRRIDAASDVAFLAMDLRYRGRSGLAERFLRRYARESDDYGLYGVVDYFMSYRALVRAKVAAIAGADARLERPQRMATFGSVRRHLSLGARCLAPGPRGAVVLMCGLVGTGKTSAAEVAADSAKGVIISSDRVRKRLVGLPPSARAGAGVDEGIYTRALTDRTYEGLLDRAAPVVDSGRVAVLDATFAEGLRRARVRDWAEQRNVPAYLLETRCDEGVALKRLARRRALGTDPSDAGPEIYLTASDRFEPPEEWPRGRHLVARTDGRGWRGALRADLRGWLSGRWG